MTRPDTPIVGPEATDSQDYYSSSHRRNPDLSKDPTFQLGLLASLESVQTPAFQPGAYPSSVCWPFNSSPIPALNTDLPSPAFSTVLNSQDSTTSLHSASSLPDSFYNQNSPNPVHSFSAPTSELRVDLSSNNIDCKEQSASEQSDGLGITPYPMSVASDAYFAGQMQPNSHPYVWANRPYQPMQSPSGHMNPPFQSPQYPSSGFPVGYAGQPGGPMPGYHPDSAPSSYMAGAPGSARQQTSRSPSMGRSFPPHTAGIPDQPLMTTSSPYMMSQPAYYLPDATPIPSSHPSSMSSPASSMVPEPVFPTDSVPTSDEHPVRVLSSRPRPQCWDHGCNGREFSTFSNLLRHQREKSGVVAKAECQICGAVFTRTTARNIHVAQGKCKGAGREGSAE